MPAPGLAEASLAESHHAILPLRGQWLREAGWLPLGVAWLVAAVTARGRFGSSAGVVSGMWGLMQAIGWVARPAILVAGRISSELAWLLVAACWVMPWLVIVAATGGRRSRWSLPLALGAAAAVLTGLALEAATADRQQGRWASAAAGSYAAMWAEVQGFVARHGCYPASPADLRGRPDTGLDGSGNPVPLLAAAAQGDDAVPLPVDPTSRRSTTWQFEPTGDSPLEFGRASAEVWLQPRRRGPA